MICTVDKGTIVMDRKLLLATLSFAGEDELAPNKTMINVTPTQVRVTDGEAALILELACGSSFQVDAVWLREELKSPLIKVVGLAVKNGSVLMTRRSTKKPSIIEATVTSPVYEETFPRVDRLIPKQLEPTTGASTVTYINPTIFARLDKFVKAIPSCEGCRLQFGAHNEPIRFDLGTPGVKIHGIIAPMLFTSMHNEFSPERE